MGEDLDMDRGCPGGRVAGCCLLDVEKKGPDSSGRIGWPWLSGTTQVDG